ncbi:MAG: hypothetical protein II454_00390 [Bacteroidales bacterium]|nr:hypothetical protein [Bacteroidales bacterium]
MKPKLKRFKEVANQCEGNISKIADSLGVGRCTVYRWIESEAGFKEAIEEQRGRLLDKCIETAGILANGVPKIIEGPNGPMQMGWAVPPDGQTLRYLLGTLGRKEGFGESVDITSKGESIKPETLTIEVIDKREQVDNI